MIRINLAETGVETSVSVLCKVISTPGAVALVPTETVYGLIARAGDERALARIFALKNRPAEKRVGWFIGNWRKLTDHGVILDGLPEMLAENFTPGALTIIAPCQDGSTQGFRVPDHLLLKHLLGQLAFPLYQTSANASGMPDPLDCDEAIAQLTGEVDCVIDGGRLPAGTRGSTVVDATGEKIKILRQGAVDLQNLL